MPSTRTTIPHRTVDNSQDTVLKLITQDSESTSSTVDGLTISVGENETEVQVGQSFIMLARVGYGINHQAAVDTHRTPFFTAKSAPFKMRVLQVGFEVVDITVAEFTDGDAGNLDITVIRGDGAASETESDVLADFALDDDYANGKGAQFPTAAVALTNNIIVEGGSLYVDLVVDPDATAGATNDGAVVDCWVHCIRVN